VGRVGGAAVGDDGVTCPPWPGALPTSTVICIGRRPYCLRCARPIQADQTEHEYHEGEHAPPTRPG
jgi:hypothetical protein